MQIINVMAASLDGKIAGHSLESDKARRDYGFTNKVDQDFVRSQLQIADAVVTGANSLRASEGAWQVPNHQGRCATWIVLTSRGLDHGLRFWGQDNVEKWIVCPAGNHAAATVPSHARNVRVIEVPNGNNIPEYVAKQAEIAGYQRVLLFGGGHVNRLFYAAGLVDELRLTLCPLMLGLPDASNLLAPPLLSPVHFRLQSSNREGDLLFLTYTVQKTP
jgi:5-amino-6-(5-phosphoribosylamino)uracil reductase